jgi:hypothetical protein
MEHPRVRDKRREQVIFLIHCCRNQTTKVGNMARCPGAMTWYGPELEYVPGRSQFLGGAAGPRPGRPPFGAVPVLDEVGDIDPAWQATKALLK